jgi:hypothetical protein
LYLCVKILSSTKMRRKIESKDSTRLYLTSIIGVTLISMLLLYFYLNRRNSMGFPFTSLEQDLRAEIRWLEDNGETLWANDSLKTLVSTKRETVKKASSNDLHKLIEYKDGYIKALAFEGLCDRDDRHLYDAIMSILADTSSFIEESFGPTSIGEYCVINVLSMQIPNSPPRPKPKYDLDKLFNKKELALIAAKYQENKARTFKPDFY